MSQAFEIRNISKDQYAELGSVMVSVYASLEGFPTPDEQPKYYEMLANIGVFSEKPGVQVLVAVSEAGTLLGGIVYFSDMSQYGSGGTATQETNASGIRLLGVDPKARGAGVGKALALACLALARENGHSQVILHTTQAMQVAWRLYQNLGFVRSADLDFMQEELPVFGFRLPLKD